MLISPRVSSVKLGLSRWKESTYKPVHPSLALLRGFDTLCLALKGYPHACSAVEMVSKRLISYDPMFSFYNAYLTPIHKHMAGCMTEVWAFWEFFIFTIIWDARGHFGKTIKFLGENLQSLQIYWVTRAYTPCLSVPGALVVISRHGVVHQRCSMLSPPLRNNYAMYIETSLFRINHHVSSSLSVNSGPYERSKPHIFCH